jgi:hypothetical protein
MREGQRRSAIAYAHGYDGSIHMAPRRASRWAGPGEVNGSDGLTRSAAILASHLSHFNP